MLQGIPFIAAGGCFASGTGSGDSGFGTGLLLSLFGLLWGIGYIYVGRHLRFVAAFVCGPVLAIASCGFAISGANYDFEHGSTDPGELREVKHGFIAAGVLLSVYVALLTVDAVMLANARNREVDEVEASLGLPMSGET
jgi:hypothetical protein